MSGIQLHKCELWKQILFELFSPIRFRLPRPELQNFHYFRQFALCELGRTLFVQHENNLAGRERLLSFLGNKIINLLQNIWPLSVWEHNCICFIYSVSSVKMRCMCVAYQCSQPSRCNQLFFLCCCAGPITDLNSLTRRLLNKNRTRRANSMHSMKNDFQSIINKL